MPQGSLDDHEVLRQSFDALIISLEQLCNLEDEEKMGDVDAGVLAQTAFTTVLRRARAPLSPHLREVGDQFGGNVYRSTQRCETISDAIAIIRSLKADALPSVDMPPVASSSAVVSTVAPAVAPPMALASSKISLSEFLSDQFSELIKVHRGGKFTISKNQVKRMISGFIEDEDKTFELTTCDKAQLEDIFGDIATRISQTVNKNKKELGLKKIGKLPLIIDGAFVDAKTTPNHYQNFINEVFKAYSAIVPFQRLELSRYPNELINVLCQILIDENLNRTELFNAESFLQFLSNIKDKSWTMEVATVDKLMAQDHRALHEIPVLVDQLSSLDKILEGPKNPSRFMDQICRCFTNCLPLNENSIEQIIFNLKRTFRDLLSPSDYFLRTCEYEAMNDLLTGNLHRLDPVIRDAGCQWRIPFILDLHIATKHFGSEENLQTIADFQEKMCSNDIPTAADFMIHQKSANKRQRAEYKQISKKRITLSDTLTLDPPLYEFNLFETFPYKKIGGCISPEYEKLFREFSKFVNTLKINEICVFDGSSAFGEISLSSHWLKRGEIFAQSVFDDNGKGNEVASRLLYAVSTMDYLSMCKSLTVRQIRHVDQFGISSHSISLTLPYFSDIDMENYQTRLAWYSNQYLYMAFTQMLEVKENEPFITRDLARGQMPMAVHLMEAMTGQILTYRIVSARGLTMSYYENKRLMYMYFFLRNIPIVLDIRRLICDPKEEDDAVYTFSGGALCLFIPDREHGSFKFVKNPSPEQASLPALCVEAYSMHMNHPGEETKSYLESVGFPLDNPTDFGSYIADYIEKMDVIDQFLISTVFHSAFPYDTKAFDPAKQHITDLKIDEDILSPGLDILNPNPKNDLYTFIEHEKEPLPLFGNRYQGQQWHICDEKDLLKKRSLEHYAYKSPYDDKNNINKRNKLTLMMGCIHLYGCTFQQKADGTKFPDPGTLVETDKMKIEDSSVLNY
jgi:hypothetical protein